MIWVIGQYADRIENSEVLLEDFLDSWSDETHEVQLALLTATVKLFIQRPKIAADLVPKVLKWATEDTDNPDLRDRGYMYWRLLSSNPAAAKGIVMGEKPAITAESEKLDPVTLEEMCLVVGTLATVYLKPVHTVFRSARARRLVDSPALQKDAVSGGWGATRLEIPAAAGNAGGGGGRGGDVLDEADAYFASIGGNGQGGGGVGGMTPQTAHDGFSHSPIGGTSPGGLQHMYVVNQGQGLGTMPGAPAGMIGGQNNGGGGEGDLLSF